MAPQLTQDGLIRNAIRPIPQPVAGAREAVQQQIENILSDREETTLLQAFPQAFVAALGSRPSFCADHVRRSFLPFTVHLSLAEVNRHSLRQRHHSDATSLLQPGLRLAAGMVLGHI